MQNQAAMMPNIASFDFGVEIMAQEYKL